MKIKVIETFGHELGCYIHGREYIVADELGREVVEANLAEDITPEAEPVVVEKLTPKKAAK